ncbi:MAG: tRNA nucleotidyltransferase, partial [Candidatus Nephrothrix sp. EaCA]
MTQRYNFKEKLQPAAVFEAIKKIAAKENMPAYVVGGFVRDLILRRPCKDIDFVCVGNGIELAALVGEALCVGQAVVFKNFGTARLRYENYELEFVGARKESYREDSRKPAVENGTLEDDQQRRDFTINALAISLNENDFGELIDPFNGMEDLRNMQLRTPLAPDVTFSDDPLRMMRAIRFSSQLQFDIDADTFDSIVKNKERISIVSMERIADELNKIILSAQPSYGFKLLFFSGMLEIIFPEMAALHGVE